MKLELTHTQKLVMNTQMQQSLKILQMNNLELETYINELAQENPLIEITPASVSREYSVFSVNSGYRQKNRNEDGFWGNEPAVYNYETPGELLREQLATMRIPELLRCEVGFLIDSLDEQGYLPEFPTDLKNFGFSVMRYENAVAVLQSLEPAGVGARDLSECLCIQLERMGEKDPVVYEICRNYLERLARGQINFIAKAIGVDQQAVVTAKERIAALSPRPFNGIEDRAPTPYIFPDLSVNLDEKGNLSVGIAEQYMPRLTIDRYYASLARNPDLPEETRSYFSDKLRQANWVTGCITQRRDTLLACAHYIVETQSDFFRYPQGIIVPLTMSRIAEGLGIHVSTVSRAISGKYLYCDRGIFPLDRFIAQEVGDTGDTRGRIREIIQQMIAEEDPATPLSDQNVSDRLNDMGIAISRRTVAKYRQEENIPSASARRKR